MRGVGNGEVSGEMAELRPGEIVAGHVIQRRIGTGGSGSVYVARHPRLPRMVALKIMHHDAVMTEAETWRRFQREADITARFDHPHIVSVYDRGVADDLLWISMQYVDGPDAGLLHATEPVRALRIASEIAGALDYAHGTGVLHRDVKPSNLLLAPADNGRSERALLTDFGIARLRDESTKLTATGVIAATFAFASPEQVSGAPLGPQSDQYSLACTLFVLLTDRRPFDADNPLGWVHAHTALAPLRLSQVRPDLPRALDGVLCRALAKDPALRYPTCTDFLNAARDAAESRTATTFFVTPPLPGNPIRPLAPSAHPTPPNPPHPVPARPVPRRGALVTALGLLFVVAAGGLGYGLFRYFASAPEVANAAKTQAFSTVSTVAPTSAAGRPASDGQVPAAFLGHWSATAGPSGDGDYALTITGGNIGDQVFSLTEKIALPGGGPATCTYTAVLESSNLATRISVAESRLDTTGSDRLCPVSAPRTDIEFRNGTLFRSGSNYAGATYTRATAQPIR
ncbi:serine/threonine-protein kinase [Nocardia tengchongensis]|uniref:serine/threonine-protein kinase n=2 Tax=Nocardia tengchongensis TaxID=2055889 RepID=UPI0033DA8733